MERRREGSGFRIQDSGFRVWGLGSRVYRINLLLLSSGRLLRRLHLLLFRLLLLLAFACRVYTGTSLTRNCHPLGPCGRPVPEALRRSLGGGALSYERGTPVAFRFRPDRPRTEKDFRMNNQLWYSCSDARFFVLRSGVFRGIGFRVSGFGFRVSGFEFRVSGFGLRVSSFEFRVSGFGLLVSGFEFRVSGLIFGLSDFGFRVLGFGFRSGFGFRV